MGGLHKWMKYSMWRGGFFCYYASVVIATTLVDWVYFRWHMAYDGLSLNFQKLLWICDKLKSIEVLNFYRTRPSTWNLSKCHVSGSASVSIQVIFLYKFLSLSTETYLIHLKCAWQQIPNILYPLAKQRTLITSR